MGYSNATMKNACIVVSYLTNQPTGATAKTLCDRCALSEKVMERLLVALVTCGAVSRKAVKPPKARGARSRYFYFVACSDPSDEEVVETVEESVASDFPKEDAEEEEDDGRNGGGGGRFGDDLPDVELAPYDPTQVEDEELSVAFEGEIPLEGYSPVGENFEGIIGAENREIIAPSSSRININTQEKKRINKRARARRAWGNNQNTQISGASRLNALVASVDLDDPEARSLRQKIASIVWDVNTRAELLDRAVAAVKLGFIRVCEIINKARRSVDEAKRAGCDVWYKFTLVVKGAFDKEGVSWVPTRPGAEPSPFLNRLVSLSLNDSSDEESEPRVVRTNGRNVVIWGRGNESH